VLGKLPVPLLNIIVVETWRVWNGVYCFFHIFLSFFVIVSLRPHGFKRILALVRNSKCIDKWQVKKLVLVLPNKIIEIKFVHLHCEWRAHELVLLRVICCILMLLMFWSPEEPLCSHRPLLLPGFTHIWNLSIGNDREWCIAF